METLSIWHLIVLLIGVGILIWIGRCGFLIARRAGFSGWTGATVAVPLVGVVALWVLALRRWPERGERTVSRD